MILNFILFAIVGLGIYFGAHYFVYYSIVKLFNVTDPANKVIIFAVILFLALSFILSSLLAHWQENALTRYLYIFSGVWLGVLVNLVLALSAVWIIWAVALNFNSAFNPILLIIPALLVAFIVSAFGIWNAFHPVVKNIQVTVKNLPAAWQGKKVVQLSDVHLGHIYQTDFLEKIVAEINRIQPAAVFITGDLFDGMDGNLEPLVQPLKKIQTGKGVYFVTGNHETYLGVDKAFSILAETKVRILKNEVVDVDGLKIIGINYPEREATNDEINILKSLQEKFAGQPNILLFHSPVNVSQAAAAGVNLQLSGHTHRGQIFPFGFITKLVYKGYDFGLHTLGDFSIYTSVGAGTWGPPMRTGNTPEITVIQLK